MMRRRRAVYPFAFRFEVAFALEDDALVNTFTVINTGRETLPASVGRASRISLAIDRGDRQGQPCARIRCGGTGADPAAAGRPAGPAVPSPIEGATLALDPALFDADALILDQLASPSVRFTAPGAEAIEVAWEGFRELGVWMRPGGDFLCIEPWRGTASPSDFDGAFRDKPGLMLIPPGDRRVLTLRIRLC